ncbi:MAG: hypothetical protein ACM3UZ_07575 [Acidobacteriota bacterium]
MKRVLALLIILLLTVSLVGCAGNTQKKIVPQSTGKDQRQNTSIVYHNTQYGFDFSLPSSWKGYAIVTNKWEGLAIGGEKIMETGPLISIRHPKWTVKHPRQDIPIMVFTVGQWESLQKDNFHIGAAPIRPSELDRNAKYVFALPARYNYAFPSGYEEVETILKNHPLVAK